MYMQNDVRTNSSSWTLNNTQYTAAVLLCCSNMCSWFKETCPKVSEFTVQSGGMD